MRNHLWILCFLFASVSHAEEDLLSSPSIELGIDAGLGMYTNGMGKTANNGILYGAKVTARVLPNIGFELGWHQVQQDETIIVSTSQSLGLRNKLQPLTLGVLFDLFGPLHFAAGAGSYKRMQEVTGTTGGLTASVDTASKTSWGFFFGLGAQYDIPATPLSVGADLRYHVISFQDEDDNLGITGADRSANYFTALASLVFRFGI